MAVYYWIGGTADWDATPTTSWSDTDGGAAFGYATPPTAADDVFFTASSGTVTVTINAAATCKNLDCTGATITLAGGSTLAVSGTTFKLVSTMTYSRTGATTFNATAGTCSITSGTKTMDHNVTFDGVGGTWSLADTCVWGDTRTLTLTNGTFTANNQNWGVGIFDSNNANTRTITMGSGTCSLSNAPAGTTSVWSTATITGLTFNADTATIELIGAATGTRSVSGGGAVLCSLKISNGSGSVVLTDVNCLDYTQTSGYTGIKTNTALTVRGSFSLDAANGTPSAGSAVLTFAATSSGKTINSGGKTLDFPVTFDGVGGGWSLSATLTLGATRTLTLTNGAFDANNQNWGVGKVAGSNANTRVFTAGSGTCSVSWAGLTDVVVDFTTTTGLTFTANTATFDLTGNTANARTIQGGSIATFPSLKISNGTDAVVTTNVNCFDYTQTSGYTTGAKANNAMTIRGAVDLDAANATPTAGANTWTLASASGTKAFDAGGKTLAFPITVNATVGAGHQLTSNLAMTTATLTFTLTQGIFDVSTYTLTTGLFVSTGASTRVLTFGTAGTIALTSTSATTVWNMATVTNMTVNGAGGLVNLTGAAGAVLRTVTSTATVTTMPSLTCSGGSSTGTLTVNNWVMSATETFTRTSAQSGTTTLVACQIGNLTYGSSYTGTTTVTTSLKIKGNVTMVSANGNWVSGTATITFEAPAATTITIASGANTWGHPITINCIDNAGIVQLTSALSSSVSTRLLTITRGILDLNGFDMSMSHLMVTSSAVTRGIAFGNGVLSLTSVATVTIISQTGLSGTVTHTYGTGYLQITGTSTLTRTITGSAASGFQLPNLVIAAAGAGAWSVATNTGFTNLTITTAFVSTWPNSAIYVDGNLSLAATGGTYTAGTNAWTFGARSTGKTLTVSRAIDWPLIFDGVGGGWTVTTSSLTTGSTKTVTITNGAVSVATTLTLSCGFLSSNNANTRSIITGAASLISLTDAVGTSTVWNTANCTGLTVTAGAGSAINVVGATAGSRQIVSDSSPVVTLPDISITSGTGDITFTNVTCGIVTFAAGAGFNGLAGCSVGGFTTTAGCTASFSNQAMTIRGSLSLNAAVTTIAGGANVWTFSATSGTSTLTTAGETLDFPITFDGVGGTWQLIDNWVAGPSRTATLTNGSVDAVNQTLQYGFISSSNSNVRSFVGSASGVWTCSGASGTLWDTSTSTNLAAVTGLMIALSNGGAGAMAISGGSATLPGVYTVNSSGTVTLTNVNCAFYQGNATYTGQLQNTAVTCRGHFLLHSDNAAPQAGANAWTFTATSSVAITTAGKTCDFPFTFNGVGGTWQLADALNTATKTLTLTNGTLDTNGQAITGGKFSASNSNTRAVDLDVGTHTFSDAAGWDCATSTNLTVTPGTSTIDMTHATPTFAGGSKTYYDLQFANGADAIITGSNTFHDIALAA